MVHRVISWIIPSQFFAAGLLQYRRGTSYWPPANLLNVRDRLKCSVVACSSLTEAVLARRSVFNFISRHILVRSYFVFSAEWISYALFTRNRSSGRGPGWRGWRSVGVEPPAEEIVDFWYVFVLLYPGERFLLSAFDLNDGEVFYTRVTGRGLG